MWQILERNPRAFLWALLLHLTLAILIFSNIDWTRGDQQLGAQETLMESSLSMSPELQDRVAQLRDPQAFQAAQEAERLQAVEEARQAAAAAEAERQRQVEQEARRRAAIEAERQAEQEAAREAQRQAELQVRREAEREARVQAEREAQRQAELEAQRRAEETAQRQAEEQAQREAEEQAQREAVEQARREAEEQAQREAEEQARREAEEQALREAEEQARREAAAAAAAHSQQLANEWVPRISARVAQFWIRPQSLQVQVSTLVRLQLNPGGEVVPGSVKVIESSGYPAFDTSVVRAIMDASPLPVPDGADFKVFKDFDFRFKP
ncbi:cell envelope integrity protein TolA [Thiorhodovibrio frisius]|uniref:TolA protein n=1 Tax=Thiorhodovibrio frisius TaxID=631362 RepID=H8Z826_9GAMM|nr:cell envelope integrity protein TolA [Thiorhodovibrio frisius]EIC19961.1 TolA protein [Thiorhodovibrio frisius]WPL20690.1 IgA-specific serine endopeptidase autotransporter precursor [Thiorhodovibrio frisius]